jgi:hypothetical protein
MMPKPMQLFNPSTTFQPFSFSMPLLLFKGVLCMMCLFMAGHAGLGEVHLGPTGGAGGGSNGTRAWGY